MEIQRLIGRSLRAAVDLRQLGARTFTLDCDVIQADGGTRTASITGGYVALALALRKLQAKKALVHAAAAEPVAAVSVGIVKGEVRGRPGLRGGLRRRGGHERRGHRRRASWSRCRAPPSTGLRAARSWTRCSTPGWRASQQLVEAQEQRRSA